MVVPYESHDFFIPIADLSPLTPKSGDSIVDDAGRQYVVSMPAGMNVYETFAGTEFCIHTKAVS